MSYKRLLLFLFLIPFLAIPLVAQEDSCPCENCPQDILDETIVHEFKLNIFNIQNNDLASPTQCVRKVGVKFKHTYLGDLTMELESPAGDKLTIIGPVTSSLGSSGQTDNTTFDVAIIASLDVAMPENGFEPKWDNEQEWQTFGGTRTGTYYPFKGKLEDFNQGRVNGTWTLRVFDLINENNDEGELLDFYVEFCDSEGLVCDPCLDEEDTPDCIFMVDAGEEIPVPDENFCLPIYAKNVAFLKDMEFAMNWDPAVIQYTGLDSFKIEFLDNSFFDITDVGNGNLSLDYEHTFDSLGLVVKDSTPIFQVCFQAIGGVGDSTKIIFPGVPVAIDVDNMTLPASAMDGTVIIAVDSTADCSRAIQLCDNSPISVDKSRGPGFEENEGADCFPSGQEHQAKWYKFDVLQSGNLEFVIRPKGEASYGFSLYKDACPINNSAAASISCQSGMPLIIRTVGVADNAQNTFGEVNQTGFQPTIAVLETETYFLLIDNFSENNIGFDIEFSGTAVIGDNTLQAKIADPATINCTQPTIRLDALSSTQGGGYIPEWSTDSGQINTTVGIYEPLILKGGNFTLKITDSRTGCISEKTVFVPTDEVYPTATAGDGGTLDCNVPTTGLSSFGSSRGDDFQVEWSTIGGNIPGSITAVNILVDSGGLYEVKITNTKNGCISTDTVSVFENFVFPHLSVADNAISCREPIAELFALSNTNAVIFEWTGGDLITPVIDTSIIVNDTGVYIIKITASNGCITTDSVIVKEERIFPIVNAGDSLELNCDNRILSLSGLGTSEGEEFKYLWTTKSGHFLLESNENSLSPQVDSGGVYQLEVTNDINGCVTIDSVVVGTSFTAPTVNLKSDTVLNCYNPEIIINAMESDSGAIYEFNWFISDGVINRGEDTYHPTIDKAGNYILNIKNTENGCVSSDIRTITADTLAPIANAGKEQTVNCTQRVVVLDGTDSSEGFEFIYSWDTGDGDIIGNTDLVTTEADSAGTYSLKVTDVSNGCESTAFVKIAKDFVIPDLSIPNDSTLTCNFPTILLNALSNTVSTSFSWVLPDGEKMEEAVIIANQIGAFSATVTAANGCTKTDTLFIDNAQNFPKVKIKKPQIITCQNKVIALNGSDSDRGGEFNYLWTTTDGHFVNETEQNTLNPGVDTGGTYLLEIKNIKTGCIAADSVVVTTSIDPPSIEFADDPGILSCTNTSVSVIAVSNVPNPSFQWKSGQTVLSNESELSVEEPGSYNIIVVNPQNNCSSRSTIEIRNDTLMPIVDAGLTKELNCAIGEVVLDGTNSSNGEKFAYLWTTQGSEDVSDSLIAIVDKPGLYSLIIINKDNGCRELDTVRVTVSRENPIADAGKDTIYCQGAEELAFILGGINTSKGENYTYRWEDVNGLQLGNEINQLVNIADTFVLEVTNINNECVIRDTVEVLERPGPKITLTTSGGINCKESELIYTATSDIATAIIHWEGESTLEDSILIVNEENLGKGFIAIAIDKVTGCIGQSPTIQVAEDRLPPLVDAGKDLELNCRDTLRLNGIVGNQNLNAAITWKTEDGNIVTDKNDLSPIVDAAGTYILNIENKENFCQAEDTVIVNSNQLLPTVELGEDQLLTCLEMELNIQPTNISEGQDFYYEWRDGTNKVLATTKELTVTLPDTYQLKVIDSTNLCANFAKIIVLDSLNPPIIDIIEPEVITCLNNEIDLNANVGIEEGSFEWTIISDEGNLVGATNERSVKVDVGGTYQIEAINNISGCSGIRSIQVIDLRAMIDIDAGTDKTITCYNDTTVLIAGNILSNNENLVYKWTASLDNFTPIDSTLVLNIKESGTYFLTVIDTLSACQSRDTVEVVEDINPIEFEIGEDLAIDCQKEEVIIGNINDLGTPEFIYEWTSIGGNIVNGLEKPAAIVNKEGLYVLNITNTLNGCTFLDSQRVIENIILPTVDIGETATLTCSESEAIIGGSTSSKGLQFVYDWTTDDGQIINGQNTAFATIDQPGSYQLTIKDTSNQCTQTATIKITEDKDFPEITLPTDLSFSCTDESISITPITAEDMSLLDFVWFTNNQGSIVSKEDEFTVEVAGPGKYFIRVGNTVNSCVTVDSLIIEDDRVLPQVANLQNRMLGCTNESITLSAIGSAIGTEIQYEWLTNNGITLSNNTTLTLDEPGTYVLKVTNTENSCSNTDTVLINENLDPPTNADFIIQTPSCNGDNNGSIEIAEVIGGTAPYQYQLDKVDTRRDPLFSNLPPDNYILTIIDELECEWDTTIQLNQPDMIEVEIQASDENLYTGDLVTLTATSNIPESEIAEILWTPEDLFDCLDCTEQTTSLSSSAAITVTVINEEGCSGMASLVIEVSLAPIPNAITPNGDGKNDFFMVPAIEENPTGFPNSELVVFNRWGDVIYRVSPYNNDWNGRSDSGQRIPEGTYYYVLRLNVREGEAMKGEVTILRRG